MDYDALKRAWEAESAGFAAHAVCVAMSEETRECMARAEAFKRRLRQRRDEDTPKPPPSAARPMPLLGRQG